MCASAAPHRRCTRWARPAQPSPWAGNRRLINFARPTLKLAARRVDAATSNPYALPTLPTRILILGAVHVLVVEDEPKTAAFLRKGLTEAGFVVDVAGDGEDGLHLAVNVHYDLVVLDIMLPDRDGWSVLAELRRAGRECRVICLTARDSVSDRVRGLELGADDYLVKPFAFSELLARIRSVLRRGPGKRAEIVRIADLEVDLVRHRATRAGQ